VSQPNGHFTISAPGGNYVISIINIPSMKGVDFTEPVEISNNRITSRTYAVSGLVPQGQLRIVLTWGATPRDMDSHLDTPSGCHVYYGQKQCKSGEAGLDTDVTDSYGPETINIRKLKPGVYRYKVHAYSSGAIEESEASVTLYGVSRHPVTFDIGRDGQVRRGAVHDLRAARRNAFARRCRAAIGVCSTSSSTSKGASPFRTPQNERSVVLSFMLFRALIHDISYENKLSVLPLRLHD
jgi:hypothetical protein